MEKMYKNNIKPFDGKRYRIWKIRIRALLDAADVLKVIDAETPAEPDKAWKKCEWKAKSMITEYLSDSLLSYAMNDYSAKEIIKNLDAIYERQNFGAQIAAHKKLLSLKYDNEKPMRSHFAVFDELILDLLDAGLDISEIGKVSYLLLSLPSTYDDKITTISVVAEKDLSSLPAMKAHLLVHELRIKNYTEEAQELMKPTHFKNKIVRNCYHCGRRGHYKRNCHFYKRLQCQQPQQIAQPVYTTGLAICNVP